MIIHTVIYILHRSSQARRAAMASASLLGSDSRYRSRHKKVRFPRCFPFSHPILISIGHRSSSQIHTSGKNTCTMGNKSSSPYPAEYAKHIQNLERLQYWTMETVHQLEKMNASQPVTKRPETDRNHKALTRQGNPLQGLHFACDKYSGNFAGTSFGDAMDVYSGTFNKLSKHSVDSQIRAFETAIMPMKVWALESHPAFLKDMRRLNKLKQEMVQAQKASAAKSRDKGLQKKAETSKDLYNSLAQQCKKEIERVEKLFWHHTWIWKMFQEIQLQHCQFSLENITKAMDSTLLEDTIPTREHVDEEDE